MVHALYAIGPVMFAAWLAWRYMGTFATPFVAIELSIGVTLLLGVHELGHLVALRRFRIPASLPAFIPFVGALIFSRELERRDAVTEGWVGIAGPIAGVTASNALIGLYALIGHDVLVLVAVVSLIVNGLNLIPVPLFDGGRTLGAVTPWSWLVGCGLLCIVVWITQSVIMILILAVSAPYTIARWRARSSTDQRIDCRSRWSLLGAYVLTLGGIVGGLALCAAIGEPAFDLIESTRR